jgi:hypothetical protein
MSDYWTSRNGEGAYLVRFRQVTPSSEAPRGAVEVHPEQLSSFHLGPLVRDALQAGRQVLIQPVDGYRDLFELRTADHNSSGLVPESNRYLGRSEHTIRGYGDAMSYWLDKGERVWLRNAGHGTVALLSSPRFMW